MEKRKGVGGPGEVHALSSGTLQRGVRRVENGGERAAGRRDACVNLRFIALATAVLPTGCSNSNAQSFKQWDSYLKRMISKLRENNSF